MMRDPDTDAWLQTLPVGTPVAIDGVEIWLKTFPVGAELGAYLLHGFSEPELQDALRQGFRVAVEFDAGFSLSSDGESLCLSQWLPGASGWTDAVEPLEKLLNQVEILRESIDPARNALANNPIQERIEQRMRKMLEGGIK
jgi:hypothetical protein